MLQKKSLLTIQPHLQLTYSTDISMSLSFELTFAACITWQLLHHHRVTAMHYFPRAKFRIYQRLASSRSAQPGCRSPYKVQGERLIPLSCLRQGLVGLTIRPEEK